MSDVPSSLPVLTPDEKRRLLASCLKRKAAVAATYPVSIGQRSLWFLSKLAPASFAYNIFGVVRLVDAFHPAFLSEAVRVVVRRHPALRTSFSVSSDGVPFQTVHESRDPEYGVTDARTWSEEELRAFWEAEADRPFDLAHDPLLRIHIFHRSGRSLLTVVVHHIVIDFWSLDLLLSELGDIYSELRRGGVPLKTTPGQTFVTFVEWEKQLLSGQLGEAHWEYWMKVLSGDLPVADLPFDFPRPAAPTYRGQRHLFALDEQRFQRVMHWSRREGLTPYMTLLSAFRLLLHHYTGQEDVLVGTPMAGRTMGGLERTVGYFVNPVVIRAPATSAMTVRGLASRVREAVLGAMEHQDYPFARLVEKLQPVRDARRSPVFQVAFAWDQPRAGGTDRRAELISELLISEQRGAAFDLELTIFDIPGSRRACFQYNGDVFAEATVVRMADHFLKAIDALPADADRRLGEVDFLTPMERGEAGAARGGAAVNTAETLVAWFERQVGQTPECCAVTAPGTSWTYRALNEQANALADQLIARGVGPEVAVGLFLERSGELVVAILAILKAGGFYLPLDPVYPDDRLVFMLQDARASLVITENNLRDRIKLGGCELLVLDDPGAFEATGLDRNPPLRAMAGSPAYLIYTSGSTGKPKGAVVTHTNVVRLFMSTHEWFQFGGADVWALFHSPAFDFSVWEIWGALLHGGRLVIVPYETSRSPDDFWRLLMEEGVTVLNQTPSAFRQLMRASQAGHPLKRSAIRLVIFGGEALDLPSLRPWFEQHGDAAPRLVNMYGITETTVHVTHRPLQRSDTGSNRSVIGKAIPDLSLYILNESGGLAPAGVAGELHVGGAGLARGYWGRPELTAERFLPDPFGGEPGGRLYRTGDLARRLADGGLEYLGRCDRQVKIRGFRLELGEIEARLAGHPAVRNVFVQMVEDTPGDRSLAAYYTLRETSVELVDLRQHLRKELPDYMVPAHWFQLSEFPLTANGKLDRDALPKPTSARPECGASFTPPQTEAEGWLANIWMKVLKLDRAGVTDNFFDLGGHSLLMVQVQSLLRERHDLEVPIIQMFQFPTIRSLAGHLSAASRPPDPESTGLARAGLRGQMSERVRERGAHRNRQRAGAQRDAQESQV